MGDAPFSGVYQVIVVRDKLTAGQTMAQGFHVARDSGAEWALRPREMTREAVARLGSAAAVDRIPPPDTRVVILAATKARMAKLIEDLTAAGIPFVQNKEIDGDLAGVVTSVGLVTADKASVDPFISHLPKAKFVRVANEEEAPQ